MHSPSTFKALLSIGELAEATGLSPDTLRAWERRYGVPSPQRLPSGHRRYPASELFRWREVAEALAKGARPAEALGAAGEVGFDDVLRTSLSRMDSARFREAMGLRGTADLETLRRIERGLSMLERADSVGDADPGGCAWAVEQLLDALCAFHGPESSAKVLVLPAAEGGRFMGVRVSLVACAFRIQGIPAVVIQRPVPAPQAAAFAKAMKVDRVVVPIPLEGRSATFRQAVREFRLRLPEQVAIWVCGPGQRRARREKGVDARCGVREHRP
jgi:hypothetical protein